MALTIRNSKIGCEISAQVAHLFQKSEFAKVDEFSPDYFEWRYQHCFGSNTKLILLENENELIGMAAIFEQAFHHKGKNYKIAQLGDLMVHPDHRCIKAVRLIYRELSQQLKNGKYDGIFTLPNAKSSKFNRFFLKLENSSVLQGYLNIVVPQTSSKIEGSFIFNYDDHQEKAQRVLSEFVKPYAKGGMYWEVDKLIDRMCKPHFKYGLATTKNALMISSKRFFAGIPFVLIMSFVPEETQKNNCDDFHNLVRASAALHKTCFVLPYYPTNGENLPSGLRIPSFIRGASHQVQTKIFKKEIRNFAKFIQPIDLDIF